MVGIKGFPATDAQVRRYGGSARRVVRVPPPQPLSRSFASVVSGRDMARDQEHGSNRWGGGLDGGFKRTYDGEGEHDRREQIFEQEARRGGRRFRDEGREADLRQELDLKGRTRDWGGNRFN